MKISRIFINVFIILSVAFLNLSPVTSAVTTQILLPKIGYSQIDIGTLGGNIAYVTGLNNSNYAVGYSYDRYNMIKAFVWEPRSRTISAFLDNLYPKCHSIAYDINNLNQIIGVYTCNYTPKPFMYDLNTKKIITLPLPSSITNPVYIHPIKINDKGYIIGGIYANSKNYPVVWNINTSVSNRGVEDISFAFQKVISGSLISINNNCDIVGFIQVSADRSKAYKMNCKDFKYTELGMLPNAEESSAKDINNSGIIAGASGTGIEWQSPVYFEKGKIIPIAKLGKNWMNTEAINDYKQIVGEFDVYGDGSITHGYLWENGISYDINTISKSANINLEINAAVDINKYGNIIGNATDKLGNNHAIILLRNPELHF